MKEALRRGKWVWGAPLGYQRGDPRGSSSLVPNPEVAPLIRHGFEAIASRRLTQVEALDELTDLGLVTRRGRPLSRQAFGELLNKIIYTGRTEPPWVR